MGKFHTFGVKADAIAREAFKKIETAEDALRKAEDAVRKYPERRGWVNAEDAARAKADLAEAQAGLKAAQDEMVKAGKRIADVRAELAEAVGKEYSAKPSEVDRDTIELLRSGIVQPDEFARLMADAKLTGNKTMTRVIARYAEQAAEAASGRLVPEDDVRVLRGVAAQGQRDDGSDVIGLFDVVTEVYNRATNSHGMIEHWDELTTRAREAL